MREVYWDRGFSSITDVHEDFFNSYGYNLHSSTRQYDSIKNYIQRLGRFAKSKKQLPYYKPTKPARGVLTRSKAIKKSRGRPRKYPKAIPREDPEDNGPIDDLVPATRYRNKS